MKLVQSATNGVIIALLGMAVEALAGEAHKSQHRAGTCDVGVYCRCPGHAAALEDVRGDIEVLHREEVVHRCAQCEERKKQERAKLAQTIIANVAQFFQGMVTLVSASGQEESDDKLKAAQCALMAQAVGNLIYTAHEHHRCGGTELDIKEDACCFERTSVLDEKLYHYMRYVIAEFIANNPEYCQDLIRKASHLEIGRPTAMPDVHYGT